MNVVFRTSFLKDVKKVRDAAVKQLIAEVMQNVEAAERIAEIKGCEKLHSRGKFYKIKTPPYRFGIYVNNGVVEFLKFGSRENFYNDFPPY